MPPPFIPRVLLRSWPRWCLGLGGCVVIAGLVLGGLGTASTPRHADIVQQVWHAKALPAWTPQHLQLVRALRVWWVPLESGAPGVDPMQPLQGTAPAVQTAQQLLQTADATLATQRLAEVARWVRPFVAQAHLVPGRYAVPEALQAQLPGVVQGHFMLHAEHLALLRAANWREVDADSLQGLLADSTQAQPLWPMPFVDGKRPYGDRSYYTIDMAELLGEPFSMDAHGQWVIAPERDAALTQWHAQTLTALQLLFLYGEIDGLAP